MYPPRSILLPCGKLVIIQFNTLNLSEFLQFRYTLLHPKPNTFQPLELGGGGGGGGGWTGMCLFFALDLVPKNLIFA